jgi:tRNA/tmRNA/rRNA uracil-C5-methylase (TrmA/RlmC/RlmD family)
VSAPAQLELSVGPAANGGSCVARHDGRVVFVRYALPGERVRARVTTRKGSYWTAEAVEVLEASADRVEPLCPVAGPGGAGCCDLAFAEPGAARAIKGSVVAEQLRRLGGFAWEGAAEPLGGGAPRGWRTRARFGVGPDGLAGLHRHRSAGLVHDLRCAQLAGGLAAGIGGRRWNEADQVHVVIDDDGRRHVATTRTGRRGTRTVEGARAGVHRVGGRTWRLPVTGFWQAHHEAAATYSALVTSLAGRREGATAWDLYGGAGLFAAALAGSVGQSGRVFSVDTSRAASAAARAALADLPGVAVVSESVRRFLDSAPDPADVAVLDPPRSGAGREVIGLLARAGVSRLIHIGCEAAAFGRDVGLYLQQGYEVESLRVFDAFPLTHHVECLVVLNRTLG